MNSRTPSFLSRLSVLFALAIAFASVSARAEMADRKQVLIETYVLRLDTHKVPADIRRILSQDPPSVESHLLSPQQRDELLKLASNDGHVIASPTLLTLAGAQAELKNVRLRRYVASVSPTSANDTQYSTNVQDAEHGLTLKVKADPTEDGKSIRVAFSPKLTSLLWMDTFTFEQAEKEEALGKGSRLVIQQPRSEEVGIDTIVTVPDGRTLLLGGQTLYLPNRTDDNKAYKQTILFLLRAATVDVLPKGDLPSLPANATIALQAKFLSIACDNPQQLRNTFLPPNQPPVLDDVRADAMVKAVQSSVMGAAVTSPRLTVASGSTVTSDTLKPTPYVGSFEMTKNSAGQLAYTPQIQTLQDGCSMKLTATVVPERNATTVSADITLTNLDALDTFTFQEKPAKVTVQQPNRRLMSLNVQTCIPDKKWLVIGPFRTEGKVEKEHRPSFISRLFGGKPRREVEPYPTDLYILIRPEALAPSAK